MDDSHSMEGKSSTNFRNSMTKDNLMRAFAGESQARNRYVFAASQAKKNGLYVISAVFGFTAAQEEQHAKIFYDHLRELSGETIFIDGGYPVDIADNMETLLNMAQHNEYEEHDSVYKSFGDIAQQEGFARIAASFRQIADIEKIHGDRFGQFSRLIQEGRLFVSEVEEEWMCLNCGFVYKGKDAPQICPVCQHDRGYFIRLEMVPYTTG